MSTTEPWTLGRLLEWTTDYLRQHGAETPRLDAEILLAKARGCRRIDLYTAFSDVAGDDVRQDFRELVKRRAAGTPVAYLVGEREFYSLPFYVSPDVLIPRPETEFLIIRLFDLIKQSQSPDQPLQILDMCTGSGCLAVTIAHHCPGAHVTAVDVSPAALAVARRNAERHQVSERVSIVESDLWERLPAEQRFHYIVANPPYVSQSEYDTLDPEIRDFEPQLALLAGPSGTEILQRIVAQAPQRLHDQGWLLCEISPMIRDASVSLFQRTPGLTDVEVTKDLEQRARVVGARGCAAGGKEERRKGGKEGEES